jgi:hypothetical protein
MATGRIGVLFGLIAALGYGTSAWWYASVSRPRLEVSPEFDLGELRHDEELELAIGFRNVGDAVLHMEQPIIIRDSASCESQCELTSARN